jgi:hypothetical protein
MEAVIEQQSQTLKVTEKVPLARIVDFRIVKEARSELRK